MLIRRSKCLTPLVWFSGFPLHTETEIKTVYPTEVENTAHWRPCLTSCSINTPKRNQRDSFSGVSTKGFTRVCGPNLIGDYSRTLNVLRFNLFF